MTGGGVNDAPALRQAEVGVAGSGATDVAKGAASAVLTTDGLASIVDLVKTGRATYQRVLTWIVNKVSRTILLAGFAALPSARTISSRPSSARGPSAVRAQSGPVRARKRVTPPRWSIRYEQDPEPRRFTVVVRIQTLIARPRRACRPTHPGAQLPPGGAAA